MNEVEPARGEPGPVLPALILLVEADRTEVDDLHRTLLLKPGLDEFTLVGADDALGDRLLDLAEPLLDLLAVRGRAELAEQVLQNVDRDVEADLELLDEVLPHDAAGEYIEELPVEIVDRHLIHRWRQVPVLVRIVHVQSHSSRSIFSSTSQRSRSSSLSASRTSTW